MADTLQAEVRSFSPRVNRVTGADMTAMFQQIARSGAVEKGCVTVIGLEALRTRLGSRWPEKCERVWEGVERHLTPRLGPNDLHLRISDVEILLVIDGTPAQALALSLNLSKELLTFFLGEQTPSDLRIERVVSLQDDLIVREPVDPATIDARPAAAATAAAQAVDTHDWSAMAFISAQGRRLELSFALEQVLSLKYVANAAVAIQPVVRDLGSGLMMGPDWRRELNFSDLVKIDLATLAAARPLWRSGEARKVIAPCSVETLTSLRGRAALVAQLALEDGAAKDQLVLEVVGIDGGTPPANMLDAGAALRRHCKAVIGRAQPNRACFQVLRDCHFSGISLDCRILPEDPRLLLAGLWSLSKAARPIARLLFAFGLPSAESLRLAETVGVTHATVREADRQAALATRQAAGPPVRLTA